MSSHPTAGIFSFRSAKTFLHIQSVTMNIQISSDNPIADLDGLRRELQHLQALQAQTLLGDFPECYLLYTELGMDFDDTQEAILDDLLDKITESHTKINSNEDFIEETTPTTLPRKKPGKNVSVTFDSDTKIVDGGRKAKRTRRDKKEKDTRRVLTAKEAFLAYLAREASKTNMEANVPCTPVLST